MVVETLISKSGKMAMTVTYIDEKRAEMLLMDRSGPVVVNESRSMNAEQAMAAMEVLRDTGWQ